MSDCMIGISLNCIDLSELVVQIPSIAVPTKFFKNLKTFTLKIYNGMLLYKTVTGSLKN